LLIFTGFFALMLFEKIQLVGNANQLKMRFVFMVAFIL